MTPLLRNTLLLGFALAALAAGYAASPWREHSPGEETSTVLVDFSLPDLDGKNRWLLEWQGQVIVLNFWATWCAPCRKEIPIFVDLQKPYQDRGVRFVGVAIDSRAAVAEYAYVMRINYPLLLAEETGSSLMAQYGNPRGALPYTVIIGRDGVIRARKLGAYEEKELISVLETLVKLDSATILPK